jgi:hypothetical protein
VEETDRDNVLRYKKFYNTGPPEKNKRDANVENRILINKMDPDLTDPTFFFKGGSNNISLKIGSDSVHFKRN